MAAIHVAAGITEEAGKEDTMCINAQQNIVVISTPKEENARRYEGIQGIVVSGNQHENDADAVIKWRNTGDDLGSDHVTVEITVPVPADQKNNVKTYTWIDWSEFRKIRDRGEADVEEIDDIDEWTDKIARNVREARKEIETDVEMEAMDSRLAHLIEAKKAIQDRWKKQRLNRRLRKKVAELNKEIENHCRVLSNQKWNEMCCAVDGQLHNGKAWNLLKHLMDETKTKSHQRDRLAKLLQREVTENGAEAVTQKLRDRYVPTTPTVVHGPYRGRSNERLDRDIEVEEVRTAMHYLNTRSAPGPDRITNKILRNLDDKSIENLTAYYNKCWRSGKLPKQWKKSKTILIPKPGKPLSTYNLRPIALTSCVGKAMEHVLHNRWQEYLEGEELYLETIIGFRQHLSTQDAMIQIRHQIIDDKTRDNKAILGLDLESAFDKVTHAAVLRQVSELNMGERSYQYIKDFLTGRSAELRAGELQADEKELGSQGTPQGAVISPMLFNLVMFRVAKRLIQIKDLCHTIYADDITLWVNGGSDAHIEATLQKAVEAIEEGLEGSGLRCSPSKSELLIYQPTKAHRTKNRESEKIKITTGDGNEIPTVNMIRILGRPPDDFKLAIRPRNGLVLSKIQISELSPPFPGQRASHFEISVTLKVPRKASEHPKAKRPVIGAGELGTDALA
ncbi:uncharacterized protein LOC144160025 [Haemaphysalis longicornis]